MPTFHDPLADAAEASEAIRGLAHASRVFDGPADTYTVFGDLTAAMRSLRQVLDQLAATHLRFRAVAHDDAGNQAAGATAALAAADVVVAAVACATEAYDQLDRLAEVIAQRIAPRLRPGQRVHWVVPTRWDGRRLLDREIVETLTEQHPGRVTPPVRETVAAQDSYTAGQPVSRYAPRSGIAADYAAAMATIIDPAIHASTN